MYHEFFQLSKPPFNNTPDPSFFYASRDHEEALATMHFGVQQRRGFVLVTGEVGSGKTLLVRMLLQRLGASASVAVIDRPPADERELLVGVCGRLGVRIRTDASLNDLLGQLERFLISRNAAGRLCVAVIDEAQSLSMAALEQLRMLGNLETATDKLMQVVMLGQPELQDTLSHPALKQLRQRLYCARHLAALTVEQTTSYVEHRLRVAGADGRTLFTPEAIAAVHGASEGLPRMINHICDNSLLMAFSESKSVVDEAIVREVLDRMMNLQSQPVVDAKVSTPVPGGVPASVGRVTPPDDASAARELDILCQRASTERNELMKLLREISASREDAAVERAQLAGAVTRGREMHEGLTTLLGTCDREADKLFIVEDRATAKTDELSQAMAAAEALQKRIKSRVSRGLSLLRGLSDAGESAKSLRQELAEVCDVADAHLGELSALNTTAGLRTEQLQVEQHQAIELEHRLQRRNEEAAGVASRLEREIDGRRAEIARFEALVETAGERQRSLGGLLPMVEAADARCSESRDMAVVLQAELLAATDDARQNHVMLQRGLAETYRARGKAGRALRRLVASTRAIDERLTDAESLEVALRSRTSVASETETRLRDAELACQALSGRLDAMASDAGARVNQLDGALSRAQGAVASLSTHTHSATALQESLQRVAGQAALSVAQADCAQQSLDAQAKALESSRIAAAEAADRMQATIASAEATQETLEQSRRAAGDDLLRVEALVRRAESVVDAIGDLDDVRENMARAMADAASAATGLTETLAALDQRMERVGSALRSAEVTSEKLDHSVQRGTGIVEQVSASERQIVETAGRLEAATAASCRQNDAARAVAERIEAGLRSAAERAAELEMFRERIDGVHRVTSEIAEKAEALAAKLESLRAEPGRLMTEASAATKQLMDAIQLAGRVVRGLSTSASQVREQIRTLKEVRASSDRGVNRLLEQSRASAEALRQWVRDAEVAKSQIATTVPDIDEFDQDDPVPGENGHRVPDLLPTLEALRERRR